jgi:hypothetical protein
MTRPAQVRQDMRRIAGLLRKNRGKHGLSPSETLDLSLWLDRAADHLEPSAQPGLPPYGEATIASLKDIVAKVLQP